MGQALGQGSKRLVVVCGIGSRRRGEKGKTNRVNRLRGGMGREPDPTRGGTAEVTGGGGRRGGALPGILQRDQRTFDTWQGVETKYKVHL